MGTFIDQAWVALMSAFAVLAFVVVMVCSIWLVKIVAEKLLPIKAVKTPTHST